MFETGPFPHLVTDRIQIAKDKIIVRASLTSRQKKKSFWFNEKTFSPFVKICFVLIDSGKSGPPGRVEMDADKLMNPKKRALHISRTYLGGRNITEWDKIISKAYRTKTITLADAMKQHEDSIVVTPALDAGENNYSDVLFEVEIDDLPYKLYDEKSQNNLPISSLELVAFTHIDAAGLISEYGLSMDDRAVQDFCSFGGNATYDLLLERVGSNLQVPKTRTILTLQDGTPYVGDYHYHPPSNPGPGKYVGYMAGPAGHPAMAMMPRLRSGEIENTKIAAKYFLDDSEFVSGYFGSPAQYILEDDGTLSVGIYPDYRPFTTSKVPMGKSAAQARMDIQRRVDEFYEKQENMSGTKIIHDPEHWITVPENEDLLSHYAFNFGVDFKALVVANSKFGAFLELDSIKRGIKFPTQSNAFEWVQTETLLNRTRIANIRISRRRKSNIPNSNNALGTSARSNFDNNEIDKVLVQTEDAKTENSFRKKLLSAINPNPRRRGRPPSPISRILGDLGLRPTQIVDPNVDFIADICEVPLSPGEGEEHIRTFKVRDYELFSKINYGYYTYVVDITIEDNIKEFFLEKVSLFQKRIKEFQVFLEAASRIVAPDVRYFGADSRTFPAEYERNQAIPPASLDGNYNPASGKYTDDFVGEGSKEYEENLRNLIHLFISMSEVFVTTTVSVEDLERSVIPAKGGQLDEAKSFMNRCQDLLAMYLSILKRDSLQEVGDLPQDTADYIYSNKESGVSSRENRFIKSSFELAMTVKSFVDGEIMMSYGVGSTPSALVDATGLNLQSHLSLQRAVDYGDLQMMEALDQKLPSARMMSPEGQLAKDTKDKMKTVIEKYKTGYFESEPSLGTGKFAKVKSLSPDRYVTSFSGRQRNILKQQDFYQYDKYRKSLETSFLNHLAMSPPDKTFSELSNQYISYSRINMPGLSFGLPNFGSAIVLPKSFNSVNTSGGSKLSGMLPLDIEKALCAARMPETIEAMLDKIKDKQIKEDVKLLTTDPRTLSAANILSKNHMDAASEIVLDYDRKIKTSFQTPGSPNSRGKKSPQLDPFVEKIAKLKMYEPKRSTRKQMDTSSNFKTENLIDKAIKEIDEVLKVKVELTGEVKKTNFSMPPDREKLDLKLAVNTHGYAPTSQSHKFVPNTNSNLPQTKLGVSSISSHGGLSNSVRKGGSY